ncbi:2,3-bisphosphoglycerate-independent phosphoglycerate mutase [Candidatus Woesearchaeota archaeon]|nr:2,3-bisphosphoglycerate-independent phosphoglycerate mutase [Candidatus Woesearchaeota archaeon]
MSQVPKLLLLILDGFGYRKEKEGNAIALANTPHWDKLWKENPHTLLEASGSAVGLPERYMGNSQVGHLTLGAGRIVDSDLMRVNNAIKNKSFFKNPALVEAFQQAKKNLRKVHLMGLLSDAGVHSHINHLFALLEMAKKQGVQDVYVHVFLDGRDTPPKSAKKYLQLLQDKLHELDVGRLATMMGRYYAMDRDNRWNREHKAYDCIVNCKGRKESDPFQALEKAYQRGENDEFVQPIIFTRTCVVEEHDSVIFFNFRSDRARELTRAFVWGKFKEFQRKKIIGLHFITLAQYDSLVNCPVAFPPEIPEKTLGEVISLAGLSQLRIAETEKWAHVTYFFNGLCECIFPHEHRIHIPSRKVTTYDKTPEMKAKEIVDVLLMQKDKHDFFVANFANGDMVGHTGKIKATIRGVEAIDREIGRIAAKFPGIILITADHGKCEQMQGATITSHTTNKVPLIIISKNKLNSKSKLKFQIKNGGLADVATTILNLLGLKKPKEMKGKSLLRMG